MDKVHWTRAVHMGRLTKWYLIMYHLILQANPVRYLDRHYSPALGGCTDRRELLGSASKCESWTSFPGRVVTWQTKGNPIKLLYNAECLYFKCYTFEHRYRKPLGLLHPWSEWLTPSCTKCQWQYVRVSICIFISVIIGDRFIFISVIIGKCFTSMRWDVKRYATINLF